MTDEEIEHQQMSDANNDLAQLRRRMEDETVPEPEDNRGSDWNPFIDTPEDDVIAVESPDAVRTQLGKYKGFQGRSRRLFGGAKFGDHRWSESQYSTSKQRFLRAFIKEQCQPWKNLPDEYVFIDMFGGLGMWADKFTGDVCAGSPLCIYSTLESEEISYTGMVFEKDKNRAEDLKKILYNRREDISVYNKDNRECVDVFKERFPGNANIQPALLYFDYTRQADSDHIKSITRQFPRSDILIHYSSTAFKRAINSPKCDKAKAHKGNAQYLTYLFGRRYWYINNWDEIRHNKFNFVSIYGSNVRSSSILPDDMETEDVLYPYDSFRGQELRRKSELTKREIEIENSYAK